MRYIPFLFISILLNSSPLLSQIWISNNTNIKLYSKAPLEDIEAKNSKATIALNLSNGKVYVKLAIRSFQFDNSLMQEHFNENYLESEKYPYAIFDGVISNYSELKSGINAVNIKGFMTIHGVKKEIAFNGELKIDTEKLEGKTFFKINPKDYDIKIPKLVVKNIAEEVEITIEADFKPLKK